MRPVPPIRIRQERPTFTRSPFSKRIWQVFVFNPGTGKFEDHSFTWTHADAIVLAQRILARNPRLRLQLVQEATA